MQLEQELRSSIAVLKKCNDLGGRTNISLGSGCDLFMKYVTRAFSLESVVSNTIPYYCLGSFHYLNHFPNHNLNFLGI